MNQFPSSYLLYPIGYVESALNDRASAPPQPDEGAPPAWLVFHERVRDAVRDLRIGDDMLLFTWLDRADRDVLRVHPRGKQARPEVGVFNTRSPNRPNPVGLHRVHIIARDGELRVQVENLEVFHCTPIIDVKSV